MYFFGSVYFTTHFVYFLFIQIIHIASQVSALNKIHKIFFVKQGVFFKPGRSICTELSLRRTLVLLNTNEQ